MSNPMFDEKHFDLARSQPSGAIGTDPTPQRGWGQAPPPASAYAPTATAAEATGTMSYAGVAGAAGLMLVVLVAAGTFGWSRVQSTSITDSLGRTVDTTTFPTGWLIGSLIVAFVLAMICSFKPPMARWLSLPYAAAEGVLLGTISHTYDIRTQGIALQAVLATVAVFGVMLLLYGSRALRVTPRMTKGIIAATIGVAAMYGIGLLVSLFTDAPLRFMDSTSPLSIGISLLVVGIAAFNLLLDFDFVERGVESGLPRYMNWYAAFGLIVTIVWLYLELLRLLSKLQRR